MCFENHTSRVWEEGPSPASAAIFDLSCFNRIAYSIRTVGSCGFIHSVESSPLKYTATTPKNMVLHNKPPPDNQPYHRHPNFPHFKCSEIFFQLMSGKVFQLISRNLLWLRLESPHHFWPTLGFCPSGTKRCVAN